MDISQPTIQKLRDLINDDTGYRSGRKLVEFFNQLGFDDEYGPGFPPRWRYTEDKLNELNDSPGMEKCIQKLFDPVNYIGKFEALDNIITNFNQYLCFDGWTVSRDGKDIIFSKTYSIDIASGKACDNSDDEARLLEKVINNIPLKELPIDSNLLPYIESRLDEIKSCLSVKAPLSVIFLTGSVLEGVLLGLANNNPKVYNQTQSAPKDTTGKSRKFNEWTLSNLIDASCEVGVLKTDVKNFSHVLRDFRNYIHISQQMSENFSPDERTAKLCVQTLKVALSEIVENKMALTI